MEIWHIYVHVKFSWFELKYINRRVFVDICKRNADRLMISTKIFTLFEPNKKSEKGSFVCLFFIMRFKNEIDVKKRMKHGYWNELVFLPTSPCTIKQLCSTPLLRSPFRISYGSKWNMKYIVLTNFKINLKKNEFFKFCTKLQKLYKAIN